MDVYLYKVNWHWSCPECEAFATDLHIILQLFVLEIMYSPTHVYSNDPGPGRVHRRYSNLKCTRLFCSAPFPGNSAFITCRLKVQVPRQSGPPARKFWKALVHWTNGVSGQRYRREKCDSRLYCCPVLVFCIQVPVAESVEQFKLVT